MSRATATVREMGPWGSCGRGGVGDVAFWLAVLSLYGDGVVAVVAVVGVERLAFQSLFVYARVFVIVGLASYHL